MTTPTLPSSPPWLIAGRGLLIRRTPHGAVIDLHPPPAPLVLPQPFPARITGSSGAAHSWVESQSTGPATYSDIPAGRSGTTSANPAYECNGRQGVPPDTIVWLTPVIDANSQTQYIFNLAAGNPGSPQSMTYTGEHPTPAATDTWSIAAQSSSRGLSLQIQTGESYDDTASTPTLYAYYRTLTFDAAGHLTAVSAESQQTIDVPDVCS